MVQEVWGGQGNTRDIGAMLLGRYIVMNLTWLFLAKQFRKKGGIRRISVIFFCQMHGKLKKMVKYELKMANNDNLTQIEIVTHLLQRICL